MSGKCEKHGWQASVRTSCPYCETENRSSLGQVPGSASSVHEVHGYGIVLPHVQNYYPVEENGAGGFEWGLKYISGVFEFFQSRNVSDAQYQRAQFISALDNWHRCGPLTTQMRDAANEA